MTAPINLIPHIDHTELSRTATWADVSRTCEDALKAGAASACIMPCYVAKARKEYPGLTICTVIGFPNGYHTTAVKVFETAQAVADGADEIDMVINNAMVREQRFSDITAEINAVRMKCQGKILKVIVETCLLNEQEKIAVCGAVSASEADYIKTSTGFSSGGATPEDIVLMKQYCVGKKIKAAGGIRTVEEGEMMLRLGAERLGSSSLLKKVLHG